MLTWWASAATAEEGAPKAELWSLSNLKPLNSPDLALFPGVKLAARVKADAAPIRGSLAVSASGQFVGFGCEDGFWVVDLRNEKYLAGGDLTSPVARAMAITADGSTVAVAHDNSVSVWDVARKARKLTLHHAHPVHALGFSADGEVLHAGTGTEETPSLEGNAQLWDIKRKRPLQIVARGSAVHALTLFPNTRSLAVGRLDGRILFRDARMRFPHFPDFPDEQWPVKVDGTVSALAYSPDGKMLAVGDSRGRLRRFKTERGGELKTQFGHEHVVTSLAFTADSAHLLSVDDVGRVIRWNASAGEQLQDWQISPLNRAITVLPDGCHVAAVHLKNQLVVLRFIAK